MTIYLYLYILYICVCYITFPFRNALSLNHVYGEAYIFVMAHIVYSCGSWIPSLTDSTDTKTPILDTTTSWIHRLVIAARLQLCLLSGGSIFSQQMYRYQIVWKLLPLELGWTIFLELTNLSLFSIIRVEIIRRINNESGLWVFHLLITRWN